MRQDPNNYWEQLERLEKLIRASELKAGVIFSFHSLVIGLFFDRMEQIRPMFESGVLFIILGSIWIIWVLISIYHCFKCFQPQIEMKYNSNVLFFRDAVYAFGDVEEFTKKILEIFGKEEEFYAQLAEQIHAESKIIDQKFKSVHKAIRYFALSVVFILVIGISWVAQIVI